MRVVKSMLLVAFLWSTLAAVLLIAFHYTNSVLVVEIHWKGNTNSEESDFLYSEKDLHMEPPRERRESGKMAEGVIIKLKHLPNHTLESMKKECSDKLCLEHLSKTERVYFDKCKQKAISMEYKFGPISNTGQCRFQNGTNRFPVALASFPGSGNTWVRGLLEKVTGFCTGALYCDCGLRTKGFIGEGIRGPSALVIKAHSKSALFSNNKQPRRILSDVPIYGGAILLIRDPKRALVAEWHREKSKRRTNSSVSNHYLYVGKEWFGKNEQWDKYINEKTTRWKAHISGWIINGKNNPFHIVRYEDLKTNTTHEVLKMVNFLGFKGLFSEASIQAQLVDGYNGFYRNHQDDFEHFTAEQKGFIHNTIKETIALLAEYGLDHSFPIRDYL